MPDDETVNQMVARNEDEFQLFQKMDMERKLEEEKVGMTNRLIQEEELPDWLVKVSVILTDIPKCVLLMC